MKYKSTPTQRSNYRDETKKRPLTTSAVFRRARTARRQASIDRVACKVAETPRQHTYERPTTNRNRVECGLARSMPYARKRSDEQSTSALINWLRELVGVQVCGSCIACSKCALGPGRLMHTGLVRHATLLGEVRQSCKPAQSIWRPILCASPSCPPPPEAHTSPQYSLECSRPCATLKRMLGAMLPKGFVHARHADARAVKQHRRPQSKGAILYNLDRERLQPTARFAYCARPKKNTHPLHGRVNPQVPPSRAVLRGRPAPAHACQPSNYQETST